MNPILINNLKEEVTVAVEAVVKEEAVVAILEAGSTINVLLLLKRTEELSD
jgi:hypothetical protein